MNKKVKKILIGLLCIIVLLVVIFTYVFRKDIKTINSIIKLDDYGSGFCNAKNLLCLGFTEIKIDRVFIGDTTIPSVQNNILLSLIDFTKRCNIDVIVEGVEEHYQADFLIKHGVYFHQGFLYSKPKALADILQEPFAMQS